MKVGEKICSEGQSMLLLTLVILREIMKKVFINDQL